MSIYVSKGNMKVKCPIFNLPSGVTCKPGVTCSSICYAKKAERLYKGARESRQMNLVESGEVDFVGNMVKELTKIKKKTYFRIHESGDFYNEVYIREWYDIIKVFPNTTFYAYTKRDDLFSKELLSLKPSNLKLIWSYDGIVDEKDTLSISIPEGYDSIAFITENYTNCPSQLSDKLTGKIYCMEQCIKCITSGNKILFKKH